jgi:DNA-binding response OmpR family regulator
VRAAQDKAGFSVTWVRDGEMALNTLDTLDYSVAVLDIGLPTISGLDVLREMRDRGNDLPVLMLTARDTTRDKVICLERGADDYLVKTSDMEELVARLRALIRRSGRAAGRKLRIGGLCLDMIAHTAVQDGNPLSLSSREFTVLRLLMEGAGRVLTRRQLETTGGDWNNAVESNAIEVHIHNLRHKIGVETIRTVRGIGYTIAKAA